MARKIKPSYADIMRSSALAEKILKFSGSDTGETQKLSALLRLEERLDDLSKKTHLKKRLSQLFNKHNRKAPVGHKPFTKAELAEGVENNWETVYNEARSFFKEAARTEIKLRSVPAGDGTVWSFEKLQSWIDESSCEIYKLLQKSILKITSGGKAGKTITITATPETDSNLIYQADAAELYNVPKATLSKAANKKTGDIGYLWSGRNGKRVFYRKSDIEKLSRSRAKLSK
jgi:hypothetical protein